MCLVEGWITRQELINMGFNKEQQEYAIIDFDQNDENKVYVQIDLDWSLKELLNGEMNN